MKEKENNRERRRCREKPIYFWVSLLSVIVLQFLVTVHHQSNHHYAINILGSVKSEMLDNFHKSKLSKKMQHKSLRINSHDLVLIFLWQVRLACDHLDHHLKREISSFRDALRVTDGPQSGEVRWSSRVSKDFKHFWKSNIQYNAYTLF